MNAISSLASILKENTQIGYGKKKILQRLSVDLVKKYVVPHLKKKEKVVFLVIDCLRLDQWFTLEPYFYDYFNITRNYYYSILPTATPFSRNAIFSGLFPEEIERKYPEVWSSEGDDESQLK